MRDLIVATVFSILSVLLFPVTLLGYVIWTGSLLAGRGSGVSATAQGPLSARWFEHNLGTREDEPADRLMMVLPGVPPLGPRLVAGPMLLDEERTYSKWREHGLLFPSTVGSPISARNLVRHFKKMLKRAGLPDIRFHDLRHSCATLLIKLGVHPRVVIEILRHTQISTTMNIYGHAIPEVNREAANALGELVKPQTLELSTKNIASQRQKPARR